MIAPPTPRDDAERLEELRGLGLLDTPPEERFDRITRLAARALRAPMAYISLIDADRQWIKSSRGLDVIETPRSVSFCGHAILSDDTMVVPDAAEDPRFCDNPMVTGPPHIRFYAGQPLHGPGGHRVGTLCVADRRPRDLGPEDREVLREAAKLVERELGLVEVVRLQRDLLAAQEKLIRGLDEAARYARSVLPAPLDGPVRARWVFEPSARLGGDSLGYAWLDPDHFAVYLLDVSGHGVGAALLAVSAANAIRSGALPGADPREPAAVLTRLNDAFPMEEHHDRYFTMWYGVFHRPSRTLTYAGAGHPPALLLTGPDPNAARAVELAENNPGVGMFPGVSYRQATAGLDPFARLYVFSDGAYEVERPDGSMMTRGELAAFLASAPDPEDVLRFAARAGRPGPLADDFSVLDVVFG